MVLLLVASKMGEGNGTPLQYSCLGDPMDGGAWWAAVHGVAKSQTWLNDFTFTFHFHALEKEMATLSSVLAWRIPGTGESGGLLSVGLHRVRQDWRDLAAAAAAAAAAASKMDNLGGGLLSYHFLTVISFKEPSAFPFGFISFFLPFMLLFVHSIMGVEMIFTTITKIILWTEAAWYGKIMAVSTRIQDETENTEVGWDMSKIRWWLNFSTWDRARHLFLFLWGKRSEQTSEGRSLGSYIRWRARVKPLVAGRLQRHLRTGWLWSSWHCCDMRPTSLQPCSPGLQESLFHTCVSRTDMCTHVNYKKKIMEFYDQGIRVNMHSQSQKETVVMEILGRTMNILRFWHGVQGHITCPTSRIKMNSFFLQWFNGKMNNKWIAVLCRISKSLRCASSEGWSHEDKRCTKR